MKSNKKITVLRDGQIRTVKKGLTWEEYYARHPEAVRVKKPSQRQLEEWMSGGGCETVGCDCWTEPDGYCEHGRPSWLLAMGLV